VTCKICAPIYVAPYSDLKVVQRNCMKLQGDFLEHQCLFSSWITFHCNVNCTILWSYCKWSPFSTECASHTQWSPVSVSCNMTEQASVSLSSAAKVVPMWAEFLKLLHILFSHALGHNWKTFLCRHTPSTGVPEGPLQVRFCDRIEYMVNYVYCVTYVRTWCAHSHIHTHLLFCYQSS